MEVFLKLTLILNVVLCDTEYRNSIVNAVNRAAGYDFEEDSCPRLNLAGLRSYGVDYSTCSIINDLNSDHYIKNLEDWKFADKNLLTDIFPIDHVEDNYIREVKGAIFSKVLPVPLREKVELLAYSSEVLSNILDLDPSVITTEHFRAFVSGNTILSGSNPLSHRYGGHQFGNWAGQLGDGRAVMLGEYVNRLGERWELQLKGSGLTPYSRRGDGRAVLRSSIREFLCSEAMHYLGVPTSRALSLVSSADSVWRDKFYNGNPKKENAAVVLRLAKSWFRIGSLEILAVNGESALLMKMVDYLIENFFPNIDNNNENKYLSFFYEVVEQTAELMAKWMSIGFTHGVMNTDNFSLLSITIDYGPFGFLDGYIPSFVPNTSDDEGRYSYENQPNVGYFNLSKLRIAMLHLFNLDQQSQSKLILSSYNEFYQNKFMDLFRRKLGFIGKHEEDEYIVGFLLRLMEETKSDFTMTFRQLSELTINDMTNIIKYGKNDNLWAVKEIQEQQYFKQWLELYMSRLKKNDSDTDILRSKRMKRTNPRYILRNWMAEAAIQRANNGDYSYLNKLLKVLQKPFVVQVTGEEEGYANRPPSWANSIKVSCSS